MLFITLVAFSALFVAGCAAFFSIKGLIVLFSGSSLAIGIMASSLEIGKLVAASFLHTYWKHISFLLKTYLCIAVLTLMGVTSLGIFGFLTGAYQVHSATVGTFESKIEALTTEKTAIETGIAEHSERIKTLTALRQDQEQRVKDAGNYKAPREQAYKAIEEANIEIKQKEESLAKDRERTIEIEKDISELKINMNTTTDVGSFKFIAAATGSTVDEAVRYFIFALIFVFDPLAVTLVLAWNKLLEVRREKKKEEEFEYIAGFKPVKFEGFEEDEEEEDDSVKKKVEPDSSGYGIISKAEEKIGFSPGVTVDDITISVEKDPQEILENRIIPDAEKELVQFYQADPVSGSPVSEIKEVLVDLDRAIEDSSLEHLLTPEELAKVKAERERRRRMSGPNNSIISG